MIQLCNTIFEDCSPRQILDAHKINHILSLNFSEVMDLQYQIEDIEYKIDQ